MLWLSLYHEFPEWLLDYLVQWFSVLVYKPTEQQILSLLSDIHCLIHGGPPNKLMF